MHDFESESNSFVQKYRDLKKIGPWTQVSDEQVYDNAWISVNHQKVITPTGTNGVYGKVHFKNLAIGILPITANGETILVGQYRYPIDAYSWEIPEGGGPLGVDPLESAKRELLEETGLKAKTWIKLQELHLSNSVSDELAIIYIATDLSQHQAQPEDTEQLELKRLPLTKAIEMVLSGEITDCMSVTALLRAKILLDNNKLSF